MLKLAWGDEPFRFKGKYYEYPYPYEEGTPWPAHEWTRQYGAAGEVDELGRIRKINIVPKPYQKPHPQLFQAFSVSEETVRWCAREGIIPTILLPQPEVVRKFAEAYQEESRKAGRNLKLGDSLGVVHCVYLADNRQRAYELGETGICGAGFRNFFHHFGFSEAWREPADEARYPSGKAMLPASEVTMDRLARVKFAFAGSVADVRKEMDAMVENVHPEWFVWQGDQGMLPIAEVKRQVEIFGKELLPRYK